MGFFQRSTSRSSSSSESTPLGTSADSVPSPKGPFDIAQMPQRGPRLDLGAIWLPGIQGMELRFEVDQKTQQVTGVACAASGSVLQIQAFAAPKTSGIWDEIRVEIAESIQRQGGAVDDVPGAFGRELLARMPVQGSDGRPGVRPARFVGIDGPRWFLRGVFSGPASIDPSQAAPLEAVFADVVVVRDGAPRPPRDVLALTIPGKTLGKPPAPEPSFDPLSRGPEITEIR